MANIIPKLEASATLVCSGSYVFLSMHIPLTGSKDHVPLLSWCLAVMSGPEEVAVL